MKRDYFSASSGTRFVECIANWATNYDDERKVSTRNDYTDIGNLVHGALEEWRNPELAHAQTYEALEACFERAATKYIFAEPLSAYKRAKELLAAAYRMTKVHPTIAVESMQTLGVEQHLVDENGDPWKMPSWEKPARGMIDHVAIIPVAFGKSNDVTLLIEDYKTGRPKSHDDLTNDDIQPPLYFLYARDKLVPWLEAQGLNVVRIIGAWTYVADGSAVPLYESDFDHEITEQYVANIQRQQAEFETKYNVMIDDVDNHEREYDPGDPKREATINKFLANYEKPNAHCSYCARKGVCQTFQRLLKYESKVDIVGPNIDWDKIAEELTAYQIMEKTAKERIGEIKSVIPVYLDQEGLASIQLSNGQEIVANPESRKKWNMAAVVTIMGNDFVLANASVTQEAIKREVDLISRTDPEKARAIQANLDGAYATVPGPRPVRTRKIDGARKTRSKR